MFTKQKTDPFRASQAGLFEETNSHRYEGADAREEKGEGSRGETQQQIETQ
jgi:hypothetical protein